MTGLLGTAYSMNQASYDLSRLARNGLIARIPHRNQYTLTGDGIASAPRAAPTSYCPMARVGVPLVCWSCNCTGDRSLIMVGMEPAAARSR